ncbi:MAG: PfkB family carbohydrate kinase [Anaerolineales bacterium]
MYNLCVSDQRVVAPVDYLVIGHLTRDRAAGALHPGGTVAYSGLTAAAFGFRAAALTACSSDEELADLRGMQVRRVASDRTTVFENLTQSGVRWQRMESVAAPLLGTAIPSEWRRPRLVHLGPVAGEVDAGLLALFPDSFRGITPQGWMRSWDAGGRISPQRTSQAEAAAGQASAQVFSLEDVGGDEGWIARLAELCPITAVTEGRAGCRVYWNGHVRHLAASSVEEVDSTGAGDIFAAAFFIRLLETRDPWEAGRLANQLAAASVGRPGLRGVPTPQEVAASKMVVEAR